MATEAGAASLRAVTLFHGLSEPELAVLGQQVVERRYGRGELIFSQGEAGDGLYIVGSGHVTISRQSAEGDELILTIYEPGEYFGELALFDREPRSASATAAEVCQLLFLSRSAFRSFLESHPAALLLCLEVVVGQLRRLTDVADELALMDVRRRLARRLLRLSQQGVLEEDARGHGAFHITQQQLASMLGATRESVNKHLNAFVDRGYIRLERGAIQIRNRTSLETISEGLE